MVQRTVIQILEHVSDEIHELWLDRHVWQTFRRITEESNVAKGSFIAAWVGEQYYRRAAVAVRAMVDHDRDSDSLINLMVRVEADPALASGYVPDLIDATSGTLDPAKVRADIDALTAAATQVRNYVNKYLAHIDKAPTQPIPAIAVVDDAVQLLGDLLRRYTLLIKNADLRVEPIVLFDWTSVFKTPWLRE
jgi:hypothetical protein